MDIEKLRADFDKLMTLSNEELAKKYEPFWGIDFENKTILTDEQKETLKKRDAEIKQLIESKEKK